MTTRLLLRHVWPDPDPATLKLIRAHMARGTFILPDQTYVRISRSGEVVIITDSAHVCESSGEWATFSTWPALPEADPAWKAASMYTALQVAVQENPLFPVAYKILWDRGIVGSDGRDWAWPSRLMGPAQCYPPRHEKHRAPDTSCECGFHAAYYVSELSRTYGDVVGMGVLVVTPVGVTVWHENAWRAQYYQVHAAVVPLDWEIPDNWDPEVPVIRARTPLVPYRAYEVGQEVWVMLKLGAPLAGEDMAEELGR